MTALATDLAALRAGGKAAVARALSAIETAPDDPAVAALLDAALAEPRGFVLGITGPPGVGKSTLINAFIARLRTRSKSVAVIAVDPSSRLSGGALLGDRTRIDTDPSDTGVFVRSMAARQRLGGLADATFPAAVLMRALYDWVVIETVGVGQSETEIINCADVVVFCAQPGSGDAVQFMKAGVTEVPDIVLVTKGDMGAPADRTAADVRGALSLSTVGGAAVAIVSAQTGSGLDAALDMIALRVVGTGDPVGLAARRHAQGRAWVESRLRESFGSVGVAAFGAGIAAAPSPFTALAGVAPVARNALHEILKNI